MPYRIAAPPEPDPPEPEHPYAAVLRREQRRARLVAAAAAAALLTIVVSAFARPAPKRAAPVVDDGARAARAEAAIAGARARAATEQARFELAVSGAIATGVAPRPDLGACPIALPRRAGLARRSAFPLLAVEANDTSGLLSLAVADVLADVGRAEVHVASGRFEEASLYARALERPDRLTSEVVVVASSWTRPRALTPTSYERGAITGRAYLYDFRTGEVACAADVHATSSATVGFAYATAVDAPPALGRNARLADSIDEDMRGAIERAVVDGMRWRAGPPR